MKALSGLRLYFYHSESYNFYKPAYIFTRFYKDKEKVFLIFYFQFFRWCFLNRCLRDECRFGLGVNFWAFSYRALDVLIWLWPGPIVKLSIIDWSFRRYIRGRKPSKSTPIGFWEFLSLLGSISRSPFQKPKSNFEKVSDIGRAFSGIFRWKVGAINKTEKKH